MRERCGNRRKKSTSAGRWPVGDSFHADTLARTLYHLFENGTGWAYSDAGSRNEKTSEVRHMPLRDRFAAISTALFAVLLLCFAGCSGDTAGGSTTCALDTDCPLGKVCQVQDKVCIVADCVHCEDNPDQICYKPTPESEGSCSAPECISDEECSSGSCREGQCSDGGCVTNDDCGDAEVCNLAGQCVESDGTCAGDADCPDGEVCKDEACVEGCSEDDDCEDEEFCNTETQACEEGCRDSMSCPSGQVCTDGDCACDETSCPDGKVCLDTGNCGDPTSCDQVTCPDGEVCNPTDLTCQAACTADSCMANEVCNPQTGLCEVDNCPGEDPTQCDGTQRPLWDPIRCFCAECLGDTDCNEGAGETCNASGSCFACQQACDAGTPGTCSGDTPYCINSCCVECVGAADCAQGQLCLDGQCGDPPNCQVDPSVCPDGYMCDANGECQPPASQGCDPDDPTTCPDSTFCDPTTLMCTGAGGGFGCGLCNPDCTCDGGATCNGFLCECDPLMQNCPAGQACIPLLNVCFAL